MKNLKNLYQASEKLFHNRNAKYNNYMSLTHVQYEGHGRKKESIVAEMQYSS